MTDHLTGAERSALMGRIRSSRNLSTERRLATIMRRYRISGWRRGSNLLGRPDFVFPKAKVTVFVDGDFWHGNPAKFRIPKSNDDYWRAKIEGNRNRDRLVTEELSRCGWRVIRVWESELADEEAVAFELKLAIHNSGK